MKPFEGFVLISPEGLINLQSLSSTRGAAQFYVVGTSAPDGRFHAWGYWQRLGWRCKCAKLEILSSDTTTDED